MCVEDGRVAGECVAGAVAAAAVGERSWRGSRGRIGQGRHIGRHGIADGRSVAVVSAVTAIVVVVAARMGAGSTAVAGMADEMVIELWGRVAANIVAAGIVVPAHMGAGNIVVAGIVVDEMVVELWGRVAANIVVVDIAAVDMEAAWGDGRGPHFCRVGTGGSKDGLLMGDAACRKTSRHAAYPRLSLWVSC